MKKNTIIVSILLSLVICIVAVLYYMTQPTSQPKDENNVASEQSIIAILNRKYLDDSSLVFTRAFEVPMNVLYLQYKNGTIYCADINSISAYDSLGNLQRIYGKAGKGPGELSQIASFVLDKEKIAIFDMGLVRATDFSYSGEVLKLFDFKSAFRRGVWSNQNKYLAILHNAGTTDNEEFELFDIQTNQSKKILVPRFNKSSHSVPFARAMELDGNLINPGHGVLFRVSSFASEFIAFDTLGNIKYHQHTIDKSPPPLIITKGSGEHISAMYDMEKSRLLNTSATADEKFLYISSNAKAPDIISSDSGINYVIVIDIYNVQDGNYVASLRVPTYKQSIAGGYPALIAIAPSGLYVYEGISVRYYTLTLPKEF